MNKKTYVNPSFEFVSFSFEPITDSTVTPTPLIQANPADILTLSSGNMFVGDTPSLEPNKYDGVQYYGVQYSDGNLSTGK